MHPAVVADTIASIEASGGTVSHDPHTGLLTINGEFTVSIVIVRCFETAGGALRWKIRFDAGLRPDITVALRMDHTNREILDYYLLPRIDMTAAKLRLAEENGLYLDAYRFASLEMLFAIAARVSIRMVA
jgi:hypothetical protein